MFFEDEDAPRPLIDTLDPWPHQPAAVDMVLHQLALGIRRICVTVPTGGGKTWIAAKVAQAALKEGWGVSLFANRKLLIEQMSKSMTEYGMNHGVRAAGNSATLSRFQVTSIQTEYSRVVKRKVWEKHDAGLFIVDEAHLNENRQSQAVYEKYLEHGGVKVGFTATPLGLDGCYDVLVQSGLNSELRECGALVPAIHFGCGEPDLSHIRRVKVGEDLSDPQNVKAIMVPGIFGRVIDKFRELNPHGLASIGFAPGVPESVGFAQAFQEAGINAAHIDGERLWIMGQEYPSNKETRRELLAMSRTGKVRIVWNRFVLREAVDMPWLRHCIFATVFGSLQSYIQSGGRVLRACQPVGKRDVVVQDHGGNWWRHGSLNSDRVWRLTDTNALMANLRADAIAGHEGEKPKEAEPFLCPQCMNVLVIRNLLATGSRCHCPNCGHSFDFSRRSRPVYQANGELVMHQGNIFRPKVTERRNDTAAKWRQMFFRAKNSGSMTFSQAAGLFCHQYGYYPPRDMPLMPLNTIDWYLPVSKVPFSHIRQEDKK